MENKTLLGGIIGFILGGFLVSVVAVMTMPQPSAHISLSQKTGDDFDRAFISSMISHHQGAVDMAQLASKNAKHDEIKQLSRNIISTQQKEIDQLKMWQNQWGYSASSDSSSMEHMDMSH